MNRQKKYGLRYRTFLDKLEWNVGKMTPRHVSCSTIHQSEIFSDSDPNFTIIKWWHVKYFLLKPYNLIARLWTCKVKKNSKRMLINYSVGQSECIWLQSKFALKWIIAYVQNCITTSHYVHETNCQGLSLDNSLAPITTGKIHWPVDKNIICRWKLINHKAICNSEVTW